MKIRMLLIGLLMMGSLLACSAEGGPEQIAVYPKEQPIAVYPHPAAFFLIDNATLDLSVTNVERAADQAKAIAFDRGGYLVSSQSWYQDGKKHVTLVLAVPARYFDTVYADLLRLGSLEGEWIASELAQPARMHEEVFSQITLYFRPQEPRLRAFSLPEWRPVRTFEKAWEVFVAIFGFLVDILIWIAVVLGPFVLLGLGIRRVIGWWQNH